MRFLGVLVLSLVGLCLWASPLSAAVPAVELVADTPWLQPTSTLEFRFARPMVSKEELGIPVTRLPFTLEPAVPGAFTWLSRSSGVFVPSGPWPLDGKFTVTVSKELKTADGKALGGDLRVELRTPPFENTALRGAGDGKETSPMPQLGLAFNLPVDPAAASPLLKFVNTDGRTVAARVRHATTRDYFGLALEKDDWQARWEKSRNPSGEDEGSKPWNADTPQSNRLMITPAEPLLPGGVWRLERAAGLRSQDGRYQERKGATVVLGTVPPFEIRTIEPASYVNSGRSVTLTFSQALAPDITAETAGKFLSVEPPVAGFRVEESFETLTIRGDFERGRDYTLRLEPTVISAEGLPLTGERVRTFRFGPVAPRVYLPEFTGHQIRGGLRKFEVASVNLRSLKVTVRRVPAKETPRALVAFEKYDKEEYDETEPHQALPADAIPGEVLQERVIELPKGPLDARQQTTLDWDELLGPKAGGAIFLTVTGEPLPEAGGRAAAAQALVQLTDIGVLWKQIEGGVRVMAFSMADGKSLAKAQVTLLDEKFGEITRGVTDEGGTVTLPMAKTPGWLLVSAEGDVHALRLGWRGEELPMEAFRLPIWYTDWEIERPRKLEIRGLIFTDRPLYRPGETVRVKGLMRVLEAKGLAAREGLKGVLILREPRGEDAGSFEVKTDKGGAFDVEVPLPTGVHGRYGLRLQLADGNEESSGSFWTSFEAADYQPNAFQVELDLPERIAPGAAVGATLRASYYFGSPVRDATARWTLRYAREQFAPEGFSGWSFGAEEASESATLTLQGAGDLAKADGLAIQPQLPEPKGAPYRGALTVEVTDINQQTVTETRMFQRDASAFYLGVAVPEGIVHRVGEEVKVAVTAVRPDGTPLPEPVEVQVELIRIRHDTVRVQGAGKAISFRTETREESMAKTTGRSVQVKQQGGQWQASQWTSASFRPPQAGGYLLRVTAKDAAGREVQSDSGLYISGPEALAWDYRNPAQMEIVADRPEYRPGETARLLLKTPISGEALVSIERDSQVLRTMRVRLEGNAPALEIPLTASDAPNVFVSVVVIRGLEQSTRKVKTAEYRYGVAMLQVRDPQAHLQVAVRPLRPEVEPGEEVEAEVIVKDGGDRPAADAEVTFFAVDDGVLALTGYKRPMPQPIFSKPLPLRVRTGLSLYRLMPEDPAALVFANKGYLIGGGGLEGPGLKLRRNFPGTAAWFPALRTDAAGKVRVRFRAPDALTRYRLVAVAHAGNDLFGSGESAFGIRKSLMVLPALGQFANVGDDLIARAVVRNESGADGVAELSLELDATAEPSQGGATTARVELRKGEARAVDIPVRLRNMGTAEWKWSASMALPGRTLEDHVLSTLSIGSPAPLLRETYLTELSAASNDLLKGVNPQLLEGSGSVAATISNTRLSSLRASVNWLWEYPYGCGEQTASMLIPWALFPELRAILPEIAKTDAEVAAAIQAQLDHLFSLQKADGGIGMWPGTGPSSPFVSAYAAIACALLQSRGVPLPEGHEQLLSVLSEGLRDLSSVRDEPLLGDCALMLYALALSGKAEPAYHEALFQRRAELTRESRALLAAAVLEARGPVKMVAQLLDPKPPAPEPLSWFSDAARERAIQLLAWSRYKPKDPEVARLVKELLGYRKSGHWGTTQTNAWALLALTRYYAAVEKGAPPVVSGDIIAHGEPTPFRVTKAQPAAGISIDFGPDAPLDALAVRNPAKSLLFGEARFVVRPPVAAQPRQDRGYAVSRSYRKLTDDGALAEAKDLKVGDRVLVTLRVETPRPGHFVAIDDPLPAILEAVNPAFKSRAAADPAGSLEWAADHREMRADRVLYFCDHLPAGAFTFRYLARVRAAGTVTAGATKVEEMYRPERFGLGESLQLSALPADVK